MTVTRVTAEFQTPALGAANPAFVGFTFNPVGGVTKAQMGAQVIMYFCWIGGAMQASTSLIGIKTLEAGAPGAADLPFPTAEVATLAALAVGSQVPTTYASVEFSGSGAAPVGTSACVSERTATLGRAGRGRHFIPFLAADCIDSNGQISSVNAGGIDDQYFNWIQGDLPTWDSAACVCPQDLSSPKTILLASCNRIPSQLKTRRK